MRVEPTSAIPFPWQRLWRKLEMAAQRIPMEANPSTAHMFIVNPLRGGGVLSFSALILPLKSELPDLKRWRGQEGFEEKDPKGDLPRNPESD